MWPPGKKKKEGSFSDIKSMEVEFVATWRRDRKEVEIMTNGGTFVLNEKTEFYIEIGNENFNPIKVQIVPDFKTRKLNFIEVLDPNAKIDKSKGIITFSGNKNKEKSIGKSLEELDEEIKKRKRVESFDVRKVIENALREAVKEMSRTLLEKWLKSKHLPDEFAKIFGIAWSRNGGYLELMKK